MFISNRFTKNWVFVWRISLYNSSQVVHSVFTKALPLRAETSLSGIMLGYRLKLLEWRIMVYRLQLPEIWNKLIHSNN
jgi:hypothetical protein